MRAIFLSLPLLFLAGNLIAAPPFSGVSLATKCVDTELEHVAVFNGPDFFFGFDLTINPQPDTTDVNYTLLKKSCEWWKPEVIHCHFGEDEQALRPSVGEGNRSDIGFLVHHEQLCQSEGRPSWYPPITHGFILVQDKKPKTITRYQLGRPLREMLRRVGPSLAIALPANTEPPIPDRVVLSLAKEQYRLILEYNELGGRTLKNTSVVELFREFPNSFILSTNLYP